MNIHMVENWILAKPRTVEVDADENGAGCCRIEVCLMETACNPEWVKNNYPLSGIIPAYG